MLPQFSALSFLGVCALSAAAMDAPNPHLSTRLEGTVDLATGQLLGGSSGSSGSPYRGRYAYRAEFLRNASAPLISRQGGIRYEGADPDSGRPGTPYCWTELTYALGSLKVSVFNEDTGIFLGQEAVPISGLIYPTQPYDGQCEPQAITSAANVLVHAADFHHAMHFDVQQGVRLETLLLTVIGNAQVVNGMLVNFVFQNRSEPELLWFAYDPSLAGSEGLRGTIRGYSALDLSDFAK